jgi:hypothetical protein
MKKWLFIIVLISFESAQSQSLKDASVAGTLICGNFGFYFPGGDLAKRFGNNSSIGGSIYRKTQSNIFLGLGSDFIYGRKVKEDAFLDSLSSGDDFIGYTGTIAEVALYQRGYTIHATVGKLLPIKKINPNSGIMLNAGVGFMQHKIRIVDLDEILLQFNDEYKKGYDRLSNGLMLCQSIQLLNLDARHRINFKIGLDFKEAFTRNRRSWNFDERRQDNKLRFDMMMGISGSWILPFYSKNEERLYFY